VIATAQNALQNNMIIRKNDMETFDHMQGMSSPNIGKQKMMIVLKNSKSNSKSP
jgi:hypothetical protein